MQEVLCRAFDMAPVFSCTYELESRIGNVTTSHVWDHLGRVEWSFNIYNIGT